MKKIAILFLGLAMSIAGVSPSAALAAGSATLTLSPTNTTVETGDNFSLSVMVTPNGESLDTTRVELDWDASKLEVLSFDLGSLFPYLSPSNEIDNTNGDLSYGAFKFGTPITSSGTLATVTFRALAASSTTISVLSSSKLISDGEEMINASALGSSSITISGEAVESEAPEETTEVEEEESSSSSSGTSDGTEADALAYFGALFGHLPSTDDEWETLHCIAYNDCYDEENRNLTYEVAALAQFNTKYGANPSTGMDWNAVHALAYTDAGMELLGISVEGEEVVVEEEVVEEEEVSYVDETLSLEAQALVYFGAFYARMPASGNDWEALHCIAYGGCQGDPRDLQAEQDALVLFGAKYAKMPATDMEWNVLHTIAYTDLLTWDEQGSEEEVMEEEVVEEEMVVEDSQEEEMVVEEETELS
ncbi:MAG: cohesin domain-containing protein, partial [Candidatus Uhrbacteria bacterium]|nr:cohesin domain-containing protein [Candidatus Uhrbacteria bacterium]